MWLLYTLSIRLYTAFIYMASLFLPKARQWVAGRKKWRESLAPLRNEQRPVAWFHCASLGEFEQGRPVMESFREQYPQYFILLTFFSPSGYEIRKNYPGADHICYLPPDHPAQVRDFLDITRPRMVFFIKYEYWYHYLRALHQRNIPVFLLSAIFRPTQHFFRWYGSWFRRQLGTIRCFFIQDEASASLLSLLGIKNFIISGDTRFDRVAAIAQHPASYPVVERYVEDAFVFLAGSTWPQDEAYILSLYTRMPASMKMILAPHEVDTERIKGILQQFGQTAMPLSLVKHAVPDEVRVLVVDSIGQLSSLYQYAHIAYIGGGFGKGIHNILEAATFGKPVFFGPNYHKFREARELTNAGGAFSIRTASELIERVLAFYNHPDRLQEVSAICKEFTLARTGASHTILTSLKIQIPELHPA